MKAYCKATGKYAVAIFPSLSDTMHIQDLEGPTPYLFPIVDNPLGHVTQIMADGVGFIICDSREEMEKYYDLTVGDDGPTKLNLYDGEYGVYAISCSPKGLENENT